MMEENTALYTHLVSYAAERNLPNTRIALPLVKRYMSNELAGDYPFKRDQNLHINYFNHSLAVAQYLIDLNVPISEEETDIALAAAICHVLVELIAFPEKGIELVDKYHISEKSLDVIRLIVREGSQTDEQKRIFYKKIQRNKLALLVRLADRGNLVQQLYGTTIQEAREYVRETRLYFFPMCIYAKENYQDLYGTISILMEKMRTLIEVTDILSSRYQEREMVLNKEMIELREENSRIQSIIRYLQQEKED